MNKKGKTRTRLVFRDQRDTSVPHWKATGRENAYFIYQTPSSDFEVAICEGNKKLTLFDLQNCQVRYSKLPSLSAAKMVARSWAIVFKDIAFS